MRAGAALLAALAVAASGCAHRLAPTVYQFDLPVYPRAAAQGSSKPSFALYRTGDSLADVYAWYLAELPPNTAHAYSAAKAQATFALFDARSRRTVHIERSGSSTEIMLTKVTD